MIFGKNERESELLEEITNLKGKLKIARTALEFYANPEAKGITIPDFYDELSFRSTAWEALKILAQTD